MPVFLVESRCYAVITRYKSSNVRRRLLVLSMNRALLVCVSVIFMISARVTASLRLDPRELHMLQKGFLRRFGFSDVPHLSNPTLPIPDHIWEIYQNATEDDDMDWIRHYYPKELFEHNSGLLISYNLSSSVRNAAQEEVIRAVLKMRVRDVKRPARVTIFAVDEQHHEIRRLLDSKTIDVMRQSHWLDFDVVSAFHSARNNYDTLTFLVDLSDVVIYAAEPHSISSVPFSRHQSVPLIVYSVLKEPSRVRRKRAMPSRRDRKKQRKQHHRNATESNLCQKKALYVDFEEIGWQEWILAPKSYEASQCIGVCPHPLPSHLNATNHAIVQSLTNSLNPQVQSHPRVVCRLKQRTYQYYFWMLIIKLSSRIIQICGLRLAGVVERLFHRQYSVMAFMANYHIENKTKSLQIVILVLSYHLRQKIPHDFIFEVKLHAIPLTTINIR
ncbi:transforming growth factor beta like domain protein [Dictyocaulus viviparus]|uniref:Transforming growth factor beta like domain protein n=1 Tax=Dictyocaulus viviparus TaxID=29172 RepID=A0A0D8YG23_DICVI|nr:transforming growth factor beta like domain protein [Dictyocaulus viviparus]